MKDDEAPNPTQLPRFLYYPDGPNCPDSERGGVLVCDRDVIENFKMLRLA